MRTPISLREQRERREREKDLVGANDLHALEFDQRLGQVCVRFGAHFLQVPAHRLPPLYYTKGLYTESISLRIHGRERASGRTWCKAASGFMVAGTSNLSSPFLVPAEGVGKEEGNKKKKKKAHIW